MTNHSGSAAGGGGIGFCGLLTIVFIVLKLCHVISWSWLWVMSPIWIPFVVAALILLVVFVAAMTGPAKLHKREIR
jgi:hypothetical protein